MSGTWLDNVVTCWRLQLHPRVLNLSRTKNKSGVWAGHVTRLLICFTLLPVSSSHLHTYSYSLRHFTTYSFRHAAENERQQKYINISNEKGTFTILQYTKLSMDVDIYKIPTLTFSQRTDTYFTAKYFLVYTRTNTHTYIITTQRLSYSSSLNNEHTYTQICSNNLYLQSHNICTIHTHWPI